MFFGYLSGKWFIEQNKKNAQSNLTKTCFTLGTVLFSLFLLFRFFNRYGNWINWSKLTFQQFLTISKYPPSLVFLLFTFALMFWLIGGARSAEKARHASKFLKIIKVYGRVPLFFYCVHLFVYGTIPFLFAVQGEVGLGMTYFIWLIGLIFLYKPCQWFFGYKKGHPESVTGSL